MIYAFIKMIKKRAKELFLTAAIIAALIAVMAAQASLSGYSEERIHEFAHKVGSNMLIVSSKTDVGKFFEMRADDAGIPANYPEKLLGSPTGKHIQSIQVQLYGESRVNNQMMPIIGSETMQGGRSITLPGSQALIGLSAAKILNVRKGDSIRVHNGGNYETYTVARVLDRAPEGLDTGIFISIDGARRILERPGAISSMRIAGCWCSLDIDELAADVEKNLPGTKALTVKGMIKAQKSMIATVKEYSVLVNAIGGLFIILIVGLLVYSQARRHSTDIALFLVVGARPWMIVATFVSVAALIGLTGGVIGWILGIALTQKIGTMLIGASLPVSGMGIERVLWAAVLLSAGSAFGPALAASRRNPVDILRKDLI